MINHHALMICHEKYDQPVRIQVRKYIVLKTA